MSESVLGPLFFLGGLLVMVVMYCVIRYYDRNGNEEEVE